MLRGRKNEAAIDYPDMGAVFAKELGRANSRVPGYVSFYSQTEGRGNTRKTSAFLGAQFAPMNLDEGMMPPNITRLDDISELDHRERAELARNPQRPFCQQARFRFRSQSRRCLRPRAGPDEQRRTVRHRAGATGDPRIGTARRALLSRR